MDIMDIADEIMKANDQPPLNITDLCDLVLIKICSYLDLYDKCLIMPQVCRRFATISSLCLPKEIDSQELKEQKWNERNTSTLFRKIGSSLRTFKIDYNHANPNYLDFMLMEIRGKYLNIENLLIKEAVKECHVTNLPKMIRKISVYTFLGNLLDLRYLYSLETLHLGVEDVPSALNWVKVGSRLKELQLSLNCEKISNNFSKIDGLLSSISDNYSVHVDLHSDIYAELQDINFGPLKDVWNVETFDISGYRTDTEDINNMLQVLAERNTIKKINIGWILCNASPVITLKTVDSLLRCSSLERIDFTSNCYIYSMMSVFIKRLRLKNIRMLYGKNTTYSADLTIEKLIKLVALKRDNADDYTNDYLHFNPMDRTLRFTLTVEDEGLRHTFSLMFLQCAPQLHWTRDYNPYIENNKTKIFARQKMIAAFFIALLVIGTAYCRSLPLQQIIPERNADSLNGNAVLIRNSRQSGGSEYIFHPNIPDTSNNPSFYPQQQQRKRPEQRRQEIKFNPVISAK